MVCAFYHFSISCSLIKCESLAGSKGYTFATWMRLEKITFRTSTAGQSLFCFLSHTGEGHGLVATLQGISLELRPYLYSMLTLLNKIINPKQNHKGAYYFFVSSDFLQSTFHVASFRTTLKSCLLYVSELVSDDCTWLWNINEYGLQLAL